MVGKASLGGSGGSVWDIYLFLNKVLIVGMSVIQIKNVII
jgi:hypothetical protein